MGRLMGCVGVIRRKNVSIFVDFDVCVSHTSRFVQCGGHPGPIGHFQLASEAAPQIQAAMGW